MTVPFDVSQYVNKITNARPAGAGNPIRDGKFMFAIKRMEIKPSDKNDGKVWFICELRTLKSEKVDVPPELVTAEAPLHEPNPVGSDCSLVTDLASQMGGANVKEVMAATLGVKHETITAEQVTEWIAKNVDTPNKPTTQPLCGRVLACKTTRSKTKSGVNAGKIGTRPHWDTVEQTPEELAGIRAMLTPTTGGAVTPPGVVVPPSL